MSTDVLEGRASAPSTGHLAPGDEGSFAFAFAKAFDAGDVTWVDDVLVFEPGLSRRVARPAPRRAPETAPRPQEARITRPGQGTPPDFRVTPAHLTWLALVPVSLLVVAGCWLATGMAESVMPGATWSAFPSARRMGPIRPEPVDQLRYLVSLTAPVLVAAFAYVAWRQVSGRRRRRRLDVAVIAVQLAGLALVVVCWILQRSYHRWFSGWNLVFAFGAACLLLLLARTSRLFVATTRHPGRAVRGLALGAAVAVAGLWLLPGVFSDANLADAHWLVPYHMQFTFDEFLSVTNGRTPLVDFVPLYSRLFPFAVEPVLRVFGPTLATFTWTMWVLSVTAVVAVYLTFRVVTGGPLKALVLYVPFVAVTTLPMFRVGDERVFLANLHGLVPLRVVGPFVLAWLCARELQRPRRGGSLALFFLAGLGVFNNPEFGLASFLGLLVALWCGHDTKALGLRRVGTYLAQAMVGGTAAAALVCLYFLGRSSALPRWDYLNHFQRVFAVEGFGMVPMPLFGLHVVIYLTFLAALVGAVMRSSIERVPHERVLNGMLAYSGVLGLGALAFWVGRSHPLSLFAMFPTWGLSVSLLAWWVLSAVAGRSAPRPATVRLWALPGLAVLTAFGLMVSAIAKTPSPAAEVERATGTAEAELTSKPAQLFDSESSFDPPAVSFVAEHTSRGEHVGILASLGHGIAERSGVVNVSPYAHPDSIGFAQQMALAVRAIERGGARKIFVGIAYPEISAYLSRQGYVPTAHDPAGGLTLYYKPSSS